MKFQNQDESVVGQAERMIGQVEVDRQLKLLKRVGFSWLRLEFAVESLDQGEAERGLKDLLFALGASTCDETENGDGSATLTFSGLGRLPGRRLRIKVEVLHG